MLSVQTHISDLLPQLMSLKVGEMVRSPVLQLVPRHKCHHPRVLVLTPASVDLHPNLELPVMRGLRHSSQQDTHAFHLHKTEA